jgi:hypothetical protein
LREVRRSASVVVGAGCAEVGAADIYALYELGGGVWMDWEGGGSRGGILVALAVALAVVLGSGRQTVSEDVGSVKREQRDARCQ